MPRVLWRGCCKSSELRAPGGGRLRQLYWHLCWSNGMSVAKQENQRLRRYVAIAHTAVAPLHRQRLRRYIYLTHGLNQSVISECFSAMSA